MQRAFRRSHELLAEAPDAASEAPGDACGPAAPHRGGPWVQVWSAVMSKEGVDTTSMPGSLTWTEPPARLEGALAGLTSEGCPSFFLSKAGAAAFLILFALGAGQGKGSRPRSVLVLVGKFVSTGNELKHHGREEDIKVNQHLPRRRACHSDLARYNKNMTKLG
jgi:hypothetical protein